ncbi:MAG: tetratricopeptide repeat protein [Gemmatimonadota bacterium]|jgi:tetratricopeptide (TPR) repeat protein
MAIDRAWVLIDADSAIAALQVARQAVDLFPDDPESHVVLGSALMALERWDDASDALEKALRLDPEYGRGHFAMADWYYRRGMWPETEVHARRALELDPSLVRAHGFLAIALLYQDQDEEADEAIDQGILEAPNDLYLAWLRAEIFNRTARPVEAVAAYRHLAELDPANLDAWVNIGRFEHILGHYEEAVVALERARELDPEWFAQADLERSILEASREGRPYNR